jgi:hypothetical protein
VPVVKQQSVLARLQLTFLALLGLLGLPAFTPYIGAGLDSSWVIAVATAADRGMSFGKGLIFSYGPLGFLASPAFAVPALGVVSVWVRITFAFLLGWLIARSLIVVAPWWAAAVVTVGGVWVLGGAFSLGAEAVLVPLLLFVGGFLDVLGTRKEPLSLRLAVLFGALAGTSLLIKFDTGCWGFLFVLGALGLHGRAIRLGLAGLASRVVAAALGFSVALLLWWGVLSQPIGDLAPWIRGSFEVLLGYDRAMVRSGGNWWDLPAAVAACVVALFLGWLLTPKGRRSYVCLLLGSASFLFTKQSFTRQDSGGHLVRIFALLVLALLVLLGVAKRAESSSIVSSSADDIQSLDSQSLDSQSLDSQSLDSQSLDFANRQQRHTMLPSSRERVKSVSLVAVVLCSAMVLQFTKTGDGLMAWPDGGFLPRAFGWLKDPAQVVVQRKQLLRNLKIGTALQTELLRGSVHIEPSETSVVLGIPAMQWKPLPIPQSYSAYTPWLDQKNAAALASSNGPEQVLYESSAIDQRVSRFESPSAMVSLICYYQSVYIDQRWTLFRRNSAGSGKQSSTSAPLNACAGPTFELNSLIGKFGQRVDLDIEGLDEYLIVGRFDGFEVTNQTRLQELATRPAQFWFRIGDKLQGAPGRFVPATAGQPHILSMPACLRNKLGSFDSGLFTNFAVFDAPPTSKRATAKDRANYRVRLEALPFKCPAS